MKAMLTIAAIAATTMGAGSAAPAQAAPVKPLSTAQAKAKARYFAKREAANKYDIRKSIGGDFRVSDVYCQQTDAQSFRFGCTYYVTGTQIRETRADGSKVVKQCTVRVQVKKSRGSGRQRGKITGSRLQPTCGDHEIPAPPPANPAPVGRVP